MMHPPKNPDRTQQKLAMAAATASAACRMLAIAWGLVFLATVLYKASNPGDDPYRCRAVLETGRWVDPADANGDRMPFHQWQPDGCLLHQYTPDEIVECVRKRDVMFVGDSTVRQMAEGLVRLLHISDDMYKEFNLSQHSNWRIPHRGLGVSFIWNPFLQTSGEWNPYSNNESNTNLEAFAESTELLIEDMHMPVPVPVDDQEGPVLLLLGAGPWFSQALKRIESGLWMEKYRGTVESVSEMFRGNLKDPFNEPLDVEDGVGSRAFFVPPSHGYLSDEGLGQGRDHSLETEQIIKYQDWLKESEEKLNFQMAWSLSQVVEGQNKTIDDPTKSGWHYIDDVSNMRTNIMLNYRCNAKLDRDRKDPSRGTCCTDYGFKPEGQLLIVKAGIVLLVVCILVEAFELVTRRSTPCSRFFNMQSGGAILLPLLMAHYADRTQMMPKGTKVFDVASLVVLCILWIVIGLFGGRRVSSAAPAKPEPITVEPEQTVVLQRQMDEWKGWIQVMLITVSWVNYNSTPGNIAVAVLVSALLFQFAYEHTTYFLITQDYSFTRVAKVLLQLNLLTALICHFAETHYHNYSFIVTATFFFIVVWATMAIKHRQLNDDSRFLFGKIVLSLAMVALLVKLTSVVQWGVSFLSNFNVHWNAHRVGEYVSTDLYIPFIGMLLAVANHAGKTPSRPLWNYLLGAAGFLAVWIFWASCTSSGAKYSTYMSWHSLVSFVPILGLVALRNVSATVRGYQSRTMAWLGASSIEMYVLHFHLLLAANAHGVLLTGAFSGDGTLLGDRWRDLIIIVPIFVWVSSWAASGSANLITELLPASSTQPESEGFQAVSNEEKDVEDGFHLERTAGRPLLARGLVLLRTLGVKCIRLITQVPSPKAIICSSGARVVFILLALWALNILNP